MINRLRKWLSLHGAIALMACAFMTCLAKAQTTPTCQPGHRFSPDDHTAIIQQIVMHAPDIARTLDYRELNVQNRGRMVLRAAQDVPGLPTWARDCIREVLNQWERQSGPLSLQDQREVDRAIILLDSARTFQELQIILNTQIIADPSVLDATKRIINSGMPTIYTSQAYVNDAARLGHQNPPAIGDRMVVKLAAEDVVGAIEGGIKSVILGPEGILAGACVGAIVNSSVGVLLMFAELWFGIG